MVGKILNSRYELKQLIGTGGMADVHMATDSLLGRTVAVKILHPQYAKDQVFVARFRQEAQAAANLNQGNIVNVYDWGIENSIYYLVMEYVEGRDLKDIILQGGQLLPERAAEIAMSICLALEAAHAQGIVHRDIKPQNVIVTYDNKIKVMDFGIAHTTGGSAMTETGTIMGTAQYHHRWLGDDRDRDHNGNRAVHQPRTGTGAHRRPALRPLLAWCRTL